MYTIPFKDTSQHSLYLLHLTRRNFNPRPCQLVPSFCAFGVGLNAAVSEKWCHRKLKMQKEAK
jgi:hypothetical protein